MRTRVRALILSTALFLALAFNPASSQAQPAPPLVDRPECFEDMEYGHFGVRGGDNPYMFWSFKVLTGPENNWAGWGPPPPGWTNRPDIPHIVNEDGTWTYFEDANPWPPVGDPRLPFPEFPESCYGGEWLDEPKDLD